MTAIIDSHAHLAWDSFAGEQAQVIERALSQAVVQIVQAGVDLKTIPEMIEISNRYPHIYFGAGLHPHEAGLWDEKAEETLTEAAGHKKMVAIGECGLDYFYNHSDRASQQTAFRAQVRLARLLGKPLIVHTRDAWDDTFAILEEEGQGQVQGVFHCFSGSPEILPRVQQIDFYVSFSGIITFKKTEALQAAAALVPDNRLLVETDCPYLAPVPHRGKRNEPAYVWLVAEKLAALRSVKLGHLADATVENTRRLFRLPAD